MPNQQSIRIVNVKVKEMPISFWHTVRLRFFAKPPSEGTTVPVIVSLTSIPSRLSILDITIASLLQQSLQPERIILWLNTEDKPRLPERLLALQGDCFQIHFCEGTSSYRKLLPTLQRYKDKVIVTCDDDMIYPANWLQHLYRHIFKRRIKSWLR